MQNAKTQQRNDEPQASDKADFLEILGALLASLEKAGVPISYTCEGGVLVLTMQGVSEARDNEGVYFVPVDEASPVPEQPDSVVMAKDDASNE